MMPKEVVEKYLARQVAKNITESCYVNLSDKTIYNDVNHFMLCNLKDAVRIQIYRDGAVSIYLHDTFIRYLVTWDTQSVYTIGHNLNCLDEFISFVEGYKK